MELKHVHELVFQFEPHTYNLLLVALIIWTTLTVLKLITRK